MVDYIEIPLESHAIHANGDDKSSLHCGKNHSMGQYSDSQSIDHRIDQCSCTHSLPYRTDGETRLPDHTLEHLPRAASAFPKKKPLFLELFNRNDLSLLPFSVCRTHNAQVIFHICL